MARIFFGRVAVFKPKEGDQASALTINVAKCLKRGKVGCIKLAAIGRWINSNNDTESTARYYLTYPNLHWLVNGYPIFDDRKNRDLDVCCRGFITSTAVIWDLGLSAGE